MNRLLKEILQPDTQASANLYRVNEPFSITDKMGPLGSNEWVQSWKNFRNGDISNKDASKTWQNIDATMDYIGEQVYSKVTNYIDNIANIDLCGIRQLKSMLDMIGYDDTTIINYPYPTEIAELLDILSINKNLLFFSNNVLSENSKTSILSSLIGATDANGNNIYPSMYLDDFRAHWNHPFDLLYISVDNIPGLHQNAYHAAELMRNINVPYLNNDTFFATNDSSIYTSTLTGMNGDEIVGFIDNNSGKIKAYSNDVDTFKQWISYNSTYDTSAAIVYSCPSLSCEDSIYPSSLEKCSFIKNNEDGNYYSINDLLYNESSASYMISGDINSISDLSVYKIGSYSYTQPQPIYYKQWINGTYALLPNPLALSFYLCDNLSNADIISDYSTKISENSTTFLEYIPTVLKTPYSFDITYGPYNTLGTYYKSTDESTGVDRQVYRKADGDDMSPAFIQSFNYIHNVNVAETGQAENIKEYLKTVFEIPHVAQLNGNAFVYQETEYKNVRNIENELITNIINVAECTINDKTGSVKVDFCYNIFKKHFYRITTKFNDITEIFESPSVIDGYHNTIPSYDKWKATTQSTTGLFGGILPEFNILRYPSAVVWKYYRNGLNNAFTKTILDFPYDSLVIDFPNNAIEFIASDITEADDEESEEDEEDETANTLAGIAYYNTDFSPIIQDAVYIGKWDGETSINYMMLSDDDYVKYCTSLFKNVLSSIVTMKYNDIEINPTGSINDYICYNISSQLYGENLFSTALDYSLPYTSKSEAVNIKVQNGVPTKFNEQYNYDLIVQGKKSIDDFTEGEQNVLFWERDNRAKARIDTQNISRYYKEREYKVKEYFKFILNFNAYISNTSILEAGLVDYNIDNNFFEILDSSIPTMWTDGKDVNVLSGFLTNDQINEIDKIKIDYPNSTPYINEDIIDKIANALGKCCIDIAKLREDAKYHTTKIYKKGTWNLLKNYIIEFLSNTLFKNVVNNTQLSGLQYNVGNFNVDLVEYSDNSEYFNIKSLGDDAYSSTDHITLNPQYWESIDNNTEMAYKLDDESIADFYYNVLGIKLIDDNGIEISYDDPIASTALKEFLTVVYESGATSATNNDITFTSNINLKNAGEKYLGTEIGDYPFYNYINTIHPSYQIHQYIYNFTKYVATNFSINNLYNTATASYEDAIQKNIASYIDEKGNIINKWINGRYDYTGYNSKEETQTVSKYQRNDGAFNMYALVEYLNNPLECAKSIINRSNNGFNNRYTLTLNKDDAIKYGNILSLPEVITAIGQIKDKQIAKISIDKYNNTIILYKNDAFDKNELGTLWIRPDNYPLAVPLFIRQVINNVPRLYENNIITYKDDSILDVVDEFIKLGINSTRPLDNGPFCSNVYDFELDAVTNYMALVIPYLDDSDSNDDIAITESNRLLGLNYCNSIIGLLKISLEYDEATDLYKQYFVQDQSGIEWILGLNDSNNNNINQFIGFCITNTADRIGNSILYAAYISKQNNVSDNFINLTIHSVNLLNPRERKVFNNNNAAIKLNYILTADNIVNGIPLYNIFFSKSVDNLIIDISYDVTNIASATPTLKNSLGYYVDKIYDIQNGSIDSVNALETVETDDVKLNILNLSKAFASISIDFELTKIENVEYFKPYTSNNYYPLFTGLKGKDTFYNVPALANLSSYNIQYVGYPIEFTNNALIYEHALPNMVESSESYGLYGTSAYHLLDVVSDNIESNVIQNDYAPTNIFSGLSQDQMVTYAISSTIGNLLGINPVTVNFNAAPLTLNKLGLVRCIRKAARPWVSHWLPIYENNYKLVISVKNSSGEWTPIYKSKNYAPAIDDISDWTDGTTEQNAITFDMVKTPFGYQYPLYVNSECLVTFENTNSNNTITVFDAYCGSDDAQSIYPKTFAWLHWTTNSTNPVVGGAPLSGDINSIINNNMIDISEMEGRSTLFTNASYTLGGTAYRQITDEELMSYNNVWAVYGNANNGADKETPAFAFDYLDLSTSILNKNDLSISSYNVDTGLSTYGEYNGSDGNIYPIVTANIVNNEYVSGYTTEYMNGPFIQEFNAVTSEVKLQYINSLVDTSITSLNDLVEHKYTEDSIPFNNIIQSSNNPTLWKMVKPTFNTEVDRTDLKNLQTAATWLTFEHDITVHDKKLIKFVPNSVELKGVVINEAVENLNSENFGVVEIDKNYQIGISYFIVDDNTNIDTVDKRTHVNVYDLNNKNIGTSSSKFYLKFDRTDVDISTTPNIQPYIQELHVMNPQTGLYKKYMVTLNQFDKNDLYKVKLNIARIIE